MDYSRQQAGGFLILPEALTEAATLENQFSSDVSKLHDYLFSPVASIEHPYLSSSFREALASLYYGLEYGTRILLLSGERGVGKTTLLRYWERRARQRDRILFVSSNAESESDVMRKLTVELEGVAPGDSNAKGRTSSPGNPFILLLDHNESSAGSALEILTHLAQLECFKAGSLRVVIAVPAAIAEELQSSEFAPHIRRVPLGSLTGPEVEGYIEYRMRMAGWKGGPPCTPTAYASIARSSSTKPSILNDVCFKLLQKLSESANGRPEQHNRDQEIPLDERDIESVISDQNSAGTQLPDKSPDQVATPKPRGNHRTAIIAGIVFILVITIVGLGYEVAIKASSVKRGNASTIAIPAPQHAIPRGGAFAGSPKAEQKTAAGHGVAAPVVSTATVHVTNTARVPSPSSAAVSLKSGRYSAEPIVEKSLRFKAALSSIASPGPLSKLSPAPLQTMLPRTAVAPREPSSGQKAAASEQRAEEKADREITLGDAYMKIGEYDKALLSFSRALVFAPADQRAEEKLTRARRAKAAEQNVLQ